MSKFNNIKRYAIAATTAAILSACGGTGSCPPDGSNGGKSPTLKLTAPNQYPAGLSSPITAYLTLTNTSDINASNLYYAIPTDTNYTGVSITVANDSSNPCKSISAHQSCTFPVIIAANANPGSFTVTATPNGSVAQKGSLFSNLENKLDLNANTLSLTANIGLTSLSPNNQNGANGISFLYSKTISANPDGSTNLEVVAVVSSASAGNFNTINLTDATGDLLDFRVLSGNSGNGLTSLTQGSIVTFMLTIPSGSSTYDFYAQTMENGSLVNQGTVANPINLANASNGILVVQPTSFNLSADSNYTTQTITYTNIGNGNVSGLVINNPLSPISLISNNCGASLSAGQSCTVVLSSNAPVGTSGTGSLSASYNNGVSTQTTVSQYNYAGHDPVSGISLISANNFEFEANTAIGFESTQVTLTNTGNVLESNFVFAFSPSQYFTISAGTSGTSCSLNGNTVTTQLAKNQSCTLTLLYSNATISNGTTRMEVNYNYNGSSIGSSNKTLSYDTVQATADFAVSPASPYTFNAIPANNVANNSVTFTYTNNGPDVASSVNVGAITGADSGYFSVISSKSNSDCANATNIPVGGTCSITVQFGPSSTAKQNATGTLTITITSATGGTSSRNVTLSGSALSPGMAFLTAVNDTESNPQSFGFLSSTSPYWLNPNTNGILKFTITNTGTATANDLIYRMPGSFCPLDPANTTCGSDFGNIKTSTLPVGQSCVVQFICNQPSGQLNQGDNLGVFTYNDESRPAGTIQLPAITPFDVNIVVPATVSATMSSESSGTNPITSVGVESDFYIVYKLSGGYNVQNMTYGVNLSNAQGGTPPISAYSPNTCTLSSVNPVCYIKLNSGGAVESQSIGYTTTGSIKPNPESSGYFNVTVPAATCNTNCIFITNFEYGYSGALNTGGGRVGIPGIPAASGELGADAICQYEAYESGSVIPPGRIFKALILDTNRTPCGSLGCGESVDAGYESNWIIRPNTSYYTTDGSFFMTSDSNGVFDYSYNQGKILASTGEPVTVTQEFWMGMSWLLMESSVDPSPITAWTSLGGGLNQTAPSNLFWIFGGGGGTGNAANCNDWTSISPASGYVGDNGQYPDGMFGISALYTSWGFFAAPAAASTTTLSGDGVRPTRWNDTNVYSCSLGKALICVQQ